MRVRPQCKKRSVYGHILIYKCHEFTRALKVRPDRLVLSLIYRMAHARASDRRNTERGVGLVFDICDTFSDKRQ